jgi:hypothetical protein
MKRIAKTLLAVGAGLLLLLIWPFWYRVLQLPLNYGGGFQVLPSPDEERRRFFWFVLGQNLIFFGVGLGLLLLVSGGVLAAVAHLRERSKV